MKKISKVNIISIIFIFALLINTVCLSTEILSPF